MWTLTLLATLSGCVEDVGKDKVKAVVEEAAPAMEEKSPAATKAWTVDASKSSIKALGAKITATHPIDFNTFEGTAKTAGGELSAVAFTVTMDGLESDHPKLTGHLKNEDFFDVAKHPTASFESTSIAKGSDAEGMTHTITGNMTVRGTTKSLTFPANVTATGTTVTATTEFTIDRQDFGVTYPGKPDDLVQDNVVMTISLVASPAV